MHKFSHIISLFLVCTGLALGGCGKASAPPQDQTGAASDSLKILTVVGTGGDLLHIIEWIGADDGAELRIRVF